jgi:hypothetical protein
VYCDCANNLAGLTDFSEQLPTMATLENAVPHRKRIATYGKAARRRIPDFSFSSLAHRSQTPEIKPSELRPSRSQSVVSVPVPKKAKTVARSSVSRTASPDSPPAGADIFDVPSSDDEAETTPRPAPKAAKMQNRKPPKVAKDTLMVKKEDGEMRKRIKLSPVRAVVQKLSPNKPITKPSPPRAKAQTTFVARPKAAAQKKLLQPKTPRKLSPIQKTGPPPSTPSPQASHSDVMDVDASTSYISPRGLQMWNDLLEPVDGDGTVAEDMSTVTDRVEVTSAARVHGKSLLKPAGMPKQRSPRTVPRRRLIDSLVEQATPDDDDDVEQDDAESDPSDNMAAVGPVSIYSNPVSRSQSVAPEIPQSASQSQSQGTQNIGPKFTYSKQRSMLAEEDFMKQLEFDMPSQPVQPTLGKQPRRGSIPTLPKLQSFHEEEEEDGVAAIRNVHELRQAGANNRFMDEIEDLLDRVGSPTATPSSMRRSGLLDIASKIKDKSFTRQFRSLGVEQRLFVHMGRETDEIAGFIMISILMALLAEANIMPHVVAQLRTQGIARLLIRLLESQTSINLLAKERKSNMSKVAQSLLSEHSEYLLSLPVWEEVQPRMQPKTISPRTVALKCLELMVRQTREAGNSGDLISKELTTKLFSILKSASDESAWEMPIGKEAVDFGLALSALESHSITARTLHDENIWLIDYLPIIADTLEIALTQPMEKFGDLQFLIFRLTLNVTNNNEKASDVFARESLIAVMGQVIVSMFKKISRFLIEEDLFVAVENLVVLEGAMINFAEWSSAARDCFQSLQDTPRDSLDSMVQLLVNNQERTSMVSSSILDCVNSRLIVIRLNPLKRIKRTLLLAISLFFSDIFAYLLPSRNAFVANSQERHCGLC